MKSSDLKIQVAEAFEPFLAPARYKAAFGGRGSSKSHSFAALMVSYAVRKQGFRGLCVREVQKSLKDSAKRLIEDKIRDFGVSSMFNPITTEVKTPGGGVIAFVGMQDHTADSIKSYEGFDVAWVEEAQTMSSRSLELLRPTIRAPGSELWFSWNPRSADDPVDKFFRGLTPPENAIIRKINYLDNPWFPDELEDERKHDIRTSPERSAHIWLGDYEPMVVGAIWNRENLHAYRRTEIPPDLERIVVAVDHAVSAEERSDEHGIVVAGRAADKRAYVLEDASLKGTPRQWADRALAMYDLYDADAIVIERNQGGDLIRHTLRTVRPSVPIVEVWASKGKHVRAEPIASMYAVGQVSHIGTFERLETEMCQVTAAGFEGTGSPNRCDALVWAITELMPQMTRHGKRKEHAVENCASYDAF